ncbi:MAG: hypothetical protein ACRCS8_04985 [Brevinema sp.]
MRYLSMFGTDGFRTFRAMLNGKLIYVPEKSPKIDSEILSQHDFSLRVQTILAPFTDNHPKIKDLAAILSPDCGSLVELHSKFAIWRPKNHLSLMSMNIMASLFELFEIKDEQSKFPYLANEYDSAIAFAEAFSIEQKEIYVPEYLSTVLPLPATNKQTKINIVTQDKKEFTKLAQTYLDEKSHRVDGVNLFKIVGHMATIIEALYQGEKKHFVFSNDPVSIALPADNLEYLLAGFYLSQSDLPIRHIYAVSSNHRMVHQFLEKGEFVFNGEMPSPSFMITLYRLLFEASRGSIEKVTRWRQEFSAQGSFKVDSTTLERLKSVFKPVFTAKGLCDQSQKEFESTSNLKSSKLALTMMTLAKESLEPILAFELENPALESSTEDYPTIMRLPK